MDVKKLIQSLGFQPKENTDGIFIKKRLIKSKDKQNG